MPTSQPQWMPARSWTSKWASPSPASRPGSFRCEGVLCFPAWAGRQCMLARSCAATSSFGLPGGAQGKYGNLDASVISFGASRAATH